MAINFKLNPAWGIDPKRDDMGREWVGWDASRSPQANYENNRGIWLLGQRAARERYATFSVEGTVQMVVEIDHIETIPSRERARRPKRAIVGRVLAEGDSAHAFFVGRLADPHRNPVTYYDDPDAEDRTCACGCGSPLTGPRDFAPGHDQAAVHDRINRRWGGTLAFMAWYDAEHPALAAEIRATRQATARKAGPGFSR